MSRTACTEPQCLYRGDLYLFSLWYFSRQAHFSVTIARRKYSSFNVVSGYEENTLVQITAKNAGGNYEVDFDPLLSFSYIGRETNMATLIGEFLQMSFSKSPKLNSDGLKYLSAVAAVSCQEQSTCGLTPYQR